MDRAIKEGEYCKDCWKEMMSDEVPTTKREKPMIEKQLEVARQNWEEWLHAVQNGHYGLAHSTMPFEGGEIDVAEVRDWLRKRGWKG